LVAEDARLPPLSKGIVNEIMAHFGLPPSRKVGELKKLLETEIANGTLEARRDDAYYLEWLESQRVCLEI
jgi:poly(A) polymerase